MQRRRCVATLISIAAAAVLATPAMAAALAATLTSDLVPGPPSGSWAVSGFETGPMTVNDFYGSRISSAPGFVDAYRKGWTSPEVGLSDNLLHYSSVFWAAFAIGNFKGSAQKDATRTSFRALTGFGTGAFEVTYAADSQGFDAGWIYFAEGDYVAAVAVSTKGNPAQNVLLDQATRQFRLLPIPTGEYKSIGYGFLSGLMVVGLIVAVMAISVVVVIVLVWRRQMRALVGMSASPAFAAVAPLSDDGRYWWNRQAWQDTAARIPPWAPISPDGTRWWDGAGWRPMPSGGGGKG